MLLPAEGEGRNAVYTAENGWEATAFDLSSAGRDKALRLAGEKGDNLTYHAGRFSDLKFKAESFDAVALTPKQHL